MKMKKAVGGRLRLLGSLPFFPVFAFLAFGSVALDFFLQKTKKKYKKQINKNKNR
jgi:hypothetical protein